MKRIYGIGLSRTGTTSLTHAMWELGCNMIHFPTNKQIFDPNTEGASDLPAALHYKLLDETFPGSKFIYTVRDRDSWIVSMEKHFNKHLNVKKEFQLYRSDVYGSVTFNKDLFLQAYDRHDKNVKEYFKGRNEQFLIMNICEGEGWTSLLPFVEYTQSVTEEFPHKRKTR